MIINTIKEKDYGANINVSGDDIVIYSNSIFNDRIDIMVNVNVGI